jgi:CRISPR-associated protein Cas2
MMGDQRNHNQSMLYVVSYDIPDDRRRARVHSALTGFGTWVQYSVFECFLARKQLLLMKDRLLKEIKESEDTIRIYDLCASCKQKVEVFGRGEVLREPAICLAWWCEARSGGISRLRASRKANAMIRAQKKLVRTKNVVYCHTYAGTALR